MQKQNLIPLAIAVVAGLAAFSMVINYTKKMGQEAHRFIIANRPIEKADEITDDMLALSAPVKTKDTKNFFLQPQDVIGGSAIAAIAKGAYILRSQVRTVDRGSAVDIPPGMRAMTLPAAAIGNMPDILRTGDYVDIIGRITGETGRPDFQTIYRGAQVVAVKKDDKGELRSLTLALSAEGAEFVSRAILQSSVNLILRTGPADDSMEEKVASMAVVEIIRGVSREKSVRVARKPVEAGEAA